MRTPIHFRPSRIAILATFVALTTLSATAGQLRSHGNAPSAAPPTIDYLAQTTLARSGFIEVFGSQFGSSGQLLIGGKPAIVASWADTRIAGYVPENAGPGIAKVQVVTDVPSNSMDLDVTLREPDGRFLWRVRMDALYSRVRPAVGPDGTIYAVDVYDRLYAVSADGALLWVALDAGSKGVDVGIDGTIYTGNENWIKAFRPDGSEKWTFEQEPRAFILQDVAVGPDDNIYGIGTNGMGVFSLTRQGTLRWANPEAYDRPIVVYTELTFGPGSGGGDQLYFSANRHTRAVRLDDGASIFTIASVGFPVVSPFDGTLHSAYAAYDPTGSQVWQFYEFLNGLQTVSATGTHYNATSMVTPRLYAVRPNGTERWQAPLLEAVGTVDADPTETVLVLGTTGVLTSAAAILGADTRNGATLWREELPPEEPDVPNPWTGGDGFHQFIDSKAAFAGDGTAAYLQTAIAAGGVVADRAFLYAVDLDPDTPPTSELLRATEITLDGRSRTQGVVIRAEIAVQDENLAPVPGATVQVTWTLPDGSTSTDARRTNRQGKALLRVAGEGGFYTLAIDDLVKAGYSFDSANSLLSKSIVWY